MADKNIRFKIRRGKTSLFVLIFWTGYNNGMKQKDGQIRLSPSTLNLFLECPKCFYLEQVEGFHRPRGIFPSLPGGMDVLIKKYFDKYRLQNKLPPEIDGKVEGKLMADLDLLNKWRSWRTGLVHMDVKSGAILSGALDDLLVNPEKGVFMPFDYKTRGFDLKEGSSDFYINQLNCYALLLEANGMKTAGFGYLCYYIPKEIKEDGQVRFEITIKKMETNPESAKQVFESAVNLIVEKQMPKTHTSCEYCSWGNDFVVD